MCVCVCVCARARAHARHPKEEHSTNMFLSLCSVLQVDAGGKGTSSGENVTQWASIDRLNMSIGLLYALCTHALDNGIK